MSSLSRSRSVEVKWGHGELDTERERDHQVSHPV